MNSQVRRNGLRKTVFFPNGGNYTGEWLDDFKHGNGKMVYRNGDKYEGEWFHDKRDGIGSFFELMDKKKKKKKYKLKYFGEWKNDQPMGNGVYYDDHGFRYEGQWKYGRRQGTGKLMIQNQEEPVYEGEWAHDVKDGRGTERYPNGDQFIGHWKQGLKHGLGSHLFISKNRRLDGVWRDNSLIGGTYASLTDAKELSDTLTNELPYLELQNPGEVVSQIKASENLF